MELRHVPPSAPVPPRACRDPAPVAHPRLRPALGGRRPCRSRATGSTSSRSPGRSTTLSRLADRVVARRRRVDAPGRDLRAHRGSRHRQGRAPPDHDHRGSRPGGRRGDDRRARADRGDRALAPDRCSRRSSASARRSSGPRSCRSCPRSSRGRLLLQANSLDQFIRPFAFAARRAGARRLDHRRLRHRRGVLPRRRDLPRLGGRDRAHPAPRPAAAGGRRPARR